MEKLPVAMRVAMVRFSILASGVLLKDDIGGERDILRLRRLVTHRPHRRVLAGRWLVKLIHFGVIPAEPTEVVVVIRVLQQNQRSLRDLVEEGKVLQKHSFHGLILSG